MRPVVGIAHVHVLNETHGKSMLTAKLHERNNIVVVDAALHHGIELDRFEAMLLGGENPFQNFCQIAPFWSYA